MTSRALPVREAPRRRGPDPSRAIQWAVVTVTSIIVIGPLLPVIYQSVIDREIFREDARFTTGNFQKLLGDPAFYTSILNTLQFALIATAIATVAGTALAILIGRSDMPGRKIFGAVALWPFFISQVVMALGYLVLYGPQGYVTGPRFRCCCPPRPSGTSTRSPAWR